MKISKKITHLICLLCLFPNLAWADIGMRELGDSLTAYTGFSRIWSPAVRVKSLRVDDNNITIRTNGTLCGFRWTPQTVQEVKRKVSVWVLDNEEGNVTIYTNKYELEELITDCSRGVMHSSKQKDLTDKNIALWPSHGLYYNKERDTWI